MPGRTIPDSQFAHNSSEIAYLGKKAFETKQELVQDIAITASANADDAVVVQDGTFATRDADMRRLLESILLLAEELKNALRR